MNHEKSKYTKGDAPEDENIVIVDQGDQLQVTISGTDDDGKPTINYTIPAGVSAKRVKEFVLVHTAQHVENHEEFFGQEFPPSWQ